MKSFRSHSLVQTLSIVAALAALAATGCANAAKKKPKPVPVVVLPPPPPPIPQRPYPPSGSSPRFVVPVRGVDGLYRSVNRGITPAQAVWNFRSAYNVAALNCNQTLYPTMTAGYRAFLKTHFKGLAAANSKVDAEFRARYGARFIPPRETYMTEVYNHYALPPTIVDFCNALVTTSQEAQVVAPAQLEAFALRSLPAIEQVYDNFYDRFEKYRADAAAWDALYAPRPVAVPAVYPVVPVPGPTTLQPAVPAISSQPLMPAVPAARPATLQPVGPTASSQTALPGISANP